MEQAQYIDELKRRWPRRPLDSEQTEATVKLSKTAIQEHPTCAKLWVMRGNLLELADFETAAPLKETVRCYRMAIKIDPFNIEAYEDLAWFLDAVLGNRRKAKRFFEKARRLKRVMRASANRQLFTSGGSEEEA